jgi:dTMP kinase
MELNLNRFISFEGIDFSGKTTQINLLKEFLTGHGLQMYVLREPGGTILSEQIRTILLDKAHSNMTSIAEIFLYSAARNQLVMERIRPLLQKGYYVIADRYVDSTTAYQGYGRQLDPEMVRQINRAATQGIMPGITFYLEVSPEIATERLKNSDKMADRLEDQGIDFYKRVFEGYKEICNKNSSRVYNIDGTQTVEVVHKKIISIIKSKAMDI